MQPLLALPEFACGATADDAAAARQNWARRQAVWRGVFDLGIQLPTYNDRERG